MASVTQSTRALRERKDGKVVKTAAVQLALETSDSENESRKYSDVVAARSSSLSSGPDEAAAKAGEANKPGLIESESSSEPAALTAAPVVEHKPEQEKDENPNPWHTVEHKTRCRASLESLNKLRKAGMKVDFIAARSPVVTAEQETAIKAAEHGLTDAEREKVRDRTLRTRIKVETEKSSESVDSVPEVRAVSPVIPSGEGNSLHKGKGIDPRNWGGAGIEPDELDLEAQRQQFLLWKELRETRDRVMTISETSSNGTIRYVLESPESEVAITSGKSHRKNEPQAQKKSKPVVIRSEEKKVHQKSRFAAKKQKHAPTELSGARKDHRSKSGTVPKHDSPLT
ncbi:hypothetical protein B0H16DRAFT_1734360 [Mycena metata]|uniref:Uncharacterized protein n=1 Tax=Mycena metata TaxID=1033252 RepID=A0AAD7HVM2_9AGAR|nr:hypothetical protein B0H16DRAFT_1734360 [Mycena metata]